MTQETHQVHCHRAETLMRVASTEALAELAAVGLLPEIIVRQAAVAVAVETSDDRDP